MKKPRSDAKLLNLPEEQQAKIVEIMLAGAPLHRVQSILKDEMGLSVALSTLSHFWEKACVPHLLRRQHQAALTAQRLAAEMTTHGLSFDAGLIEALKQKAMEILVQPNADPEAIAFVIAQALKARDQDIKIQQLQFTRQKFEFDAAKACLEQLPKIKAIASDNSLDDDAKTTAIREAVFGELPVSPEFSPTR